uniref:Peroxin-3 n=1 Tax=Aplanochytrium stocchinoi TaxID=215587 RepID=A0A6S7ZCT1_9STRA|mmetsp:Transcript_35451/g.43788  ORF Transcript_35451/g.43788 Transcript_35451/m.43788 type:complete len:591 (+) Transcript_35451:514-2286(+)|eukprot:CAMPEP_0204822048 /NCGR_PEP_ID=MMETSP1346-20131115/235_1 /ASSEMBLY_ACC=CAM_ASM_000771 /TAXON_ID=215587 /ORGANISM="Aplanochytrium stocchinoi, Strain GSBS06" /LENGTH=590 /DNA_ID=CAMNT_0051948061 /DNA_START=443 /DNA_END=2215 /DNA_ORIENTATION=-
MSDYVRGGFAFIKRHKKKFFALGTISALGVFGYYYAKRMVRDGMRQVEEIGRDLQKQMMEQQQRQDELSRIRGECARMVVTFVPPIRSIVKEYTDPKPVTERLKAYRQKAHPQTDDGSMETLWEELKIVSLARLFGSIYALCLLNAVLKIQMHVMARIAFAEQVEARKARQSKDTNNSNGAMIDDADVANTRTTKVTREVRERFLFLGSDHLMNRGEGMKILLKRVSDAIRIASKDWLMGTDATVTRAQILELISSIRVHVEKGNESAEVDMDEVTVTSPGQISLSPSARQWIIHSLIPEDESQLLSPDRELDEQQNAILQDMLNETMDMIESPIFAQVAEQSFECVFAVLNDELKVHKFKAVAKKNKKEAQSTALATDGKTDVKENVTGSESVSSNQDANAKATVELLDDDADEDEPEQYLLTKVIVALLKQVAGETLADDKGDNNLNKYVSSLKDVSSADTLCEMVFQQGVEDNTSNPFGGLGDFGIGEEDMKALTGLLGGLGGAGGDDELMKLLGGEGGLMSLLGGMGGDDLMAGGANPLAMLAGMGMGAPPGQGGTGLPPMAQDEEFMRLLQQMSAGSNTPAQEIQ